jgi:carboxymethylenebutenolidase
VAATNKDMKGAVAWYGPPARPYQGASGPVTGFDLAKDIHIPFLGLYGETDQNPKPEDARRFGELVKQHNQHVEVVVYPGAGHGFHADYRPSYNAPAATDAWKRCTDFFSKNLKA